MKKNTTFNEYQSQLKKILLFFDTLCRENDIKYTVLDGTLLGAVRHKGMIPWDGDIDVALTPKEFSKLQNAFSKYNGRYFLNYLPNHNYSRRGRKHDFPTLTAKIIDKNCSSSIFGIDVFTIDFLGDNYEYAQETVDLYRRYNQLIRYVVSFHIPEEKNMKRSIAIILYPLLKGLSLILSPLIINKYLKFREARIDNNNEDSKFLTIEPYVGRVSVMENELLKEGYVDLNFDDFKVMAAKNYDSYLRPTYGDYMKLPPEEKRIPYPSEDILENCKFEDSVI